MKKPLSEKFGRRAIRAQQPIEQFYGIVQCQTTKKLGEVRKQHSNILENVRILKAKQKSRTLR